MSADAGPSRALAGSIDLEVVSDIACPWCFIAHRRLARILASSPELAATTTIRWRAFLLQPDLPEEGVDAQAWFDAKFGGRDRVRMMWARVAQAGAEEGIAFAFDRQARAASTRRAHRMVAVAQSEGDATPVVDALFSGHFEHGLDLGDTDAVVSWLTDREALADPGAFRERVATGEGEAEVAEDLRFARAVGVTGVPFVIANRRIAVSGAQPEAVFRELLAAAMEPPAA
jgi:predicted DsbA family dithiol-disulfide isomerase